MLSNCSRTVLNGLEIITLNSYRLTRVNFFSVFVADFKRYYLELELGNFEKEMKVLVTVLGKVFTLPIFDLAHGMLKFRDHYLIICSGLCESHDE